MAAVIPFRRTMTVDYGRLEVVAPGLRRIHAHNPSPFTFHGTGTYVLGQGTVAVIDPGPRDPHHVTALLTALAARGERVGQILVTHTHLDHSPAADLLRAETGAPVYGFAARATPACTLDLPALDLLALDLPLPDLPALDEETDAGFTPDITLADGDQISGDGFTLTALHTPGHIADHLCFAWDEGQGVFTGDHVMGWATSVVAPPDGDMGDYFASLARIARRDDRVLYPTHGPAIDDPAPFLAAYIAHRHERERQIFATLMSGPHTIHAIVTQLYAGLDPRLHKAAALSVLAHLLHLGRQGQVRAEAGEPFAAHWRITA